MTKISCKSHYTAPSGETWRLRSRAWACNGGPKTKPSAESRDRSSDQGVRWRRHLKLKAF